MLKLLYGTKLYSFIDEIFFQDSKFVQDKFHLNSDKGWDRLRAYFWTQSMSTAKMDECRDYFGKASRVGRLWRSIAFPPQMRPFYDLFSFYMTQEHIEFLQSLRNDKKSSSCRVVATEFSKKFPETKITEACIYDGRWLCLYAFDLTGDKNLEV